MSVNINLITIELNNLLTDIDNNCLLEKSDITSRLKNIINLINVNYKKSKPLPIISQSNNVNNNYIFDKELDSDKLNHFLEEKKLRHDEINNIHEKNLNILPIDNNFDIYKNNYESINNNNTEEIYYSPILLNSDYFQMKKMN